MSRNEIHPHKGVETKASAMPCCTEVAVWKHEGRARTASENRESDQIGIARIQVVIE